MMRITENEDEDDDEALDECIGPLPSAAPATSDALKTIHPHSKPKRYSVASLKCTHDMRTKPDNAYVRLSLAARVDGSIPPVESFEAHSRPPRPATASPLKTSTAQRHSPTIPATSTLVEDGIAEVDDAGTTHEECTKDDGGGVSDDSLNAESSGGGGEISAVSAFLRPSPRSRKVQRNEKVEELHPTNVAKTLTFETSTDADVEKSRVAAAATVEKSTHPHHQSAKPTEKKRSTSPFSENAMRIAASAWKTFQNSFIDGPEEDVGGGHDDDETESVDSLEDSKAPPHPESSPLAERVRARRSATRSAEKRRVDAKLKEIEAAVCEKIGTSCNLVKLDLKARRVELLKPIKFVKNTILVERKSKRILEQAALVLCTLHKVVAKSGESFGVQQLHFECGGHTHAKTLELASSELHMRVSQERADAIRRFLLAEGCNAAYLTAKGYGGTMPIGRPSMNRRVEITVVKTSPIFMSF